LNFSSKVIGQKENIIKLIQFTLPQHPDIYNLAFGNLQKDDPIDEETTNDNKNRDKILVTVSAAIYEFSSLYPYKFIFFCGIKYLIAQDFPAWL
jgi:hypothetical protein